MGDGATWWTPIGMNFENPTNVQALFEGSITWATLWRVPDAAAWTFENGQPLAAPFEGEIA